MEEYVKDGVKGFVIAGAFGSRGHEGKIIASKFCRENNVPLFGICLGFQMMVVDICRHILNWTSANSSEFTNNTN